MSTAELTFTKTSFCAKFDRLVALMLLNLGILSLAFLFLICFFVAIRTPLEISNNGNYLVQNGTRTQT